MYLKPLRTEPKFVVLDISETEETKNLEFRTSKQVKRQEREILELNEDLVR